MKNTVNNFNIMDTVEINSSKRKMFLLLLGSLLFVVFGFLFIITPEIFVFFLIRNIFFIRVIGILTVLFFGLCLITLVKEFFTREFNIIINEEGVIDNSGYASVGVIKWEDIISIKSSNIMSTKLLLINVKDPEKYINSKQKIKKRILKSNFKILGTPISISSNTLNYDFSKLEEIIIKSHNMYRLEYIDARKKYDVPDKLKLED